MPPPSGTQEFKMKDKKQHTNTVKQLVASSSLKNKRIYLDFRPGYKKLKDFESEILILGGIVESCFSKDVQYVISNCPRAKEYSRRGAKSDASSNTPSPFARDSPQAASPATSEPPMKDKPITRGRLLANKATLNTRQGSADLLDRAKHFGIKIFYIDDVINWVKKQIEKIPSHLKRNKQCTKKITKVRRLNSPYLKFEDESKHYRPVRQELDILPRINYNSLYGSCPFFNRTKHDNRTEHEDRAEVEERDNQDCYNREMPEGGDNSQAKSSRKDSTVAWPALKSQNMSPTKKSTPSHNPQYATMATAAGKRPSRDKKRPEKQKGYCELCNVKYDHIDTHVKCDTHRRFIRTSNNFTQLDKTIARGPTLERLLQAAVKRGYMKVPSGNSNSSQDEEDTNLLSSYQSEGAKHQRNRCLPFSPTDAFPSNRFCRSQENAKDSQQKYPVGKETSSALTPNLKLVKASYVKTPRVTDDCDIRDSSQVCEKNNLFLTVTPFEKPRTSCLRKRIGSPQNLKSANSPVKNTSVMSPVVSLARIIENSELSSKSGQLNQNNGNSTCNIRCINEPIPRVARPADKTPRQKDVDRSNGDLSINYEMVVQTKLCSIEGDIKAKLQHSDSSRRLNYCDRGNPKNTASVCPKKLRHSTYGKGTNTATCPTEDDLEPLNNSLSLPCANHLTLSPTIRLKKLASVKLFKDTTTTNQTLETNSIEESTEVNASHQSETRTSWSSSTSIKRKLLRNSERNVKRRKKGKNAKDFKKPLQLHCSLEISSDQSPGISPVMNQKNKQKSLHSTCTSETPKNCNEAKNTFTRSLLAEWGTLPKSTRIQQKMLEEIEREPSMAGTTNLASSPYNRVFSLPCPLQSPSAGKTPTTKRRPDYAQTSPLVGKQTFITKVTSGNMKKTPERNKLAVRRKRNGKNKKEKRMAAKKNGSQINARDWNSSTQDKPMEKGTSSLLNEDVKKSLRRKTISTNVKTDSPLEARVIKNHSVDVRSSEPDIPDVKLTRRTVREMCGAQTGLIDMVLISGKRKRRSVLTVKSPSAAGDDCYRNSKSSKYKNSVKKDTITHDEKWHIAGISGTRVRKPGKDVPSNTRILSTSSTQAGGQNEMSRDASKCNDSLGHRHLKMRDTKRLSEDCFDVDEVETCLDIECEISDDTKNVGHNSTSENYPPERSINRDKIPKNVKNKHLKQIEIGKPGYKVRSPKKENNILRTKRACAKTSQVAWETCVDENKVPFGINGSNVVDRSFLLPLPSIAPSNVLHCSSEECVNLLSGMSDSDDSDWDEHVPKMLDKRLNESIPSTNGQYKSSFTVSTTTSGKRVMNFDCTFEHILALPGGDTNLWRTSPRKRVRTDRTKLTHIHSVNDT